MDVFSNFDLISVGIATAAIGILGFAAFFSNPRSTTNKAFLLFSLLTIAWSFVNYLIYQPLDHEMAIWILRIAVFFAVWHTFSFFNFLYVMPKEKMKFPFWYYILLVPMVSIVSILTLTPFVFVEVAEFANDSISRVDNGPGVVVFGVTIVGLVLGGFSFLLRKLWMSTNLLKKQFQFILLGSVLTFSLLIIFNFIFPALLDNPRFIPLGGVFMFPFVAFTAYAIIKHRALNIKVIGSGILVFIISILALSQVVFFEGVLELLFSVGLFFFILVFGVLLIRSIIREVEAREEIEMLAKDLEKANERLKELDKLKSEFISIASHQLRSPLTAMKGYASLILEGSFGTVSDAVKEAVQRIFDSSQTMYSSVEDFLNVSRIEQGRMKYEKRDFDLSELIGKVVEELRPLAEKRKLEFSFSKTSDRSEIHADLGKVKQIVSNLADNAIKYTKEGSVKISLSKQENMFQITIKDTGVGISAETLPRLFDRFVRDRNARKINVSGSGLGLYVAKQLTEGHGGKIKVESEGEDKGTTFTIELPAR